MRPLYFVIAICLIMFCVGGGLQAQNKLYLHAKDGTKASFSLDGIRKLTFPSRTITVYQDEGNTRAFPFVDLRQARFTEFLSGTGNIDFPRTDRLSLFPNPVNSELNISLACSIGATVEIRILDVQGRTVSIKKESIQPGNQPITLQLPDLSRGLYVCRVTNGRSIETRKFLKN